MYFALRSLLLQTQHLRLRENNKTESEDPRKYQLLEWIPYQGIIMVAQLRFGMYNIRPRLPSCHRREVLRQLRGQSTLAPRTMTSLASLRLLQTAPSAR